MKHDFNAGFASVIMSFVHNSSAAFRVQLPAATISFQQTATLAPSSLQSNVTSGSAIAEGPREALVSRNPATTKYLTWKPYRVALFVWFYV